MTARRLCLVPLALILIGPGTAAAQDSHWGVVASVTPQWQVPSQLKDAFGGTVDVKGTDFTVGIVHGRALSGDWGVSYIRKTVKDGSTVAKIDQQCNFSNGCFQKGDAFSLQSTSLNGVEVHKFVPFATFHERVQIGMNFAGGVGSFTGNLTKTTYKAQAINNANPPAGSQLVMTTNETIKDETSVSTLPLLKIQLAVSIIAAPAFKIRIQGGADLPGYEIFSIVGVYFIGAK
jgi:hypothetical protein